MQKYYFKRARIASRMVRLIVLLNGGFVTRTHSDGFISVRLPARNFMIDIKKKNKQNRSYPSKLRDL